MTNLNKLVTLTQERVKNITVLELTELFPMITEGEREMLSKAIRSNKMPSPTEYYRSIGVALEMIIYRLTQEKVKEEI